MTSYISKFPSEMETFHCTWRTSFNIYFSVSLSGKLFCQSEKISFTINFRRYEVESCYGAVLRWRRNRMERPLSPPQIHQKNIWMLSKFHKTTSECWQRTSGTQKVSHCLWKEVGQNIKDKNRDIRVRDGDLSQGGSHEGEVSKHQETSHRRVCGEFWSLRGQHNQEGKINK